MKRLYQAMDKIRQNQIESSVSSIHNEFNQNNSSISKQSPLTTNSNENFVVDNNATVTAKA
jgi:hypothetical protein